MNMKKIGRTLVTIGFWLGGVSYGVRIEGNWIGIALVGLGVVILGLILECK